MIPGKKHRTTLLAGLGMAVLTWLNCAAALSDPLAIRDEPLFLNASAAPLNMLVVGRDHRLYYEAYNDASDLNGDGTVDTGYLPTRIDYYGYFDSHRCYTYDSGTSRFNPTSVTADKTCAGASEWSGDWLNYMTTARIDALRKVLYGGTRYIDTTDTTVLQRSHVPQDAHSWGKEYDPATAGYDITLYTPLSMPDSGKRHLFANTTLSADSGNASTNPGVNGVAPPKFRVLANRGNNRVWEWVSKEQPVAGSTIDNSRYGGGTNDSLTSGSVAGTLTDYVVRVRVCVAIGGAYESNCRAYPGGSVKPTGLLQDYGENDTMFFGLLSGSYGKPHDGGVLRKAVSSFKNELDLSTGQFKFNLDPPGIVSTLDRFRVMGFNGSSYSCGWITTSADASGSCSMWGNPTAEMMVEGLRYFAGKGASTSDFSSGANNSQETSLGLKVATWDGTTNPYRSGGFPSCAKPFETVISDINPSFDSDKVPGSIWAGSYSGDLSGMDASSLGQTIWDNEIGGSPQVFVGQSGNLYDGVPTPKTASSFGTIRGIAPEAPAKEGSYHAGSVAYYGNKTDVNPASGDQRVQTFAVALASPLPTIKIPVNGSNVTLVPFAKSVGPAGGSYPINAAKGAYQPTNQIVDYYVESLTPTSGVFRINFEDVEQGADHDMDAIATYRYDVSGGAVKISVTSDYAAGSIIQHMGFYVSGTTEDGTYLVVRDRDTASTGDVDYFLDSPNVAGTALPLSYEHTFSPKSGADGGPRFLKDPLWYAAKWGGFRDENGNGLPDLRSEWASNAAASNPDPDPDNYFLVTNALRLKDQLAKAFDAIVDRSGSSSSASVSSGSINTDTRVYQATFESRYWNGHLLAFPIGTGSGSTAEGAIGAQLWDAAQKLPAADSRRVFTVGSTVASGTTGIFQDALPFRWDSLSTTLKQELDPTGDVSSDATTAGDERLKWLRGDRSQEAPSGVLRKRQGVLGDIVNSAPIFVGAPAYRYPDSIAAKPYSGFVSAQKDRPRTVYVGANDGMLHAFDAETGVERWGFIPRSVFRTLYKLPDPKYTHLFTVDGTPAIVDAFFGSDWHSVLVAGLNKGGQGIYALDVTDPRYSESTTDADKLFLWEFTDQQDADLGYTYSRPAVVKMRNGRWAAVFGNGYNNTEPDGHASSTGHAVLFVVDIADGKLMAKLDTGAGSTSTPNGLATPAVVDLDQDGTADYVYAGDLQGHLWKFDLTSTDASSWTVLKSGSTPTPLFTAVNASGVAQPITSRPQVGRGPRGRGVVVLFGTGKFLESQDRNLASLTTESFYGIYDIAGQTVSSRSDLVQQRILSEVSTTLNGSTVKARITSEGPVDASSKKGWYMDLVSPAGFEGEMQVTDSVLRNGRIVFTTLIPDPNPCAFGGRSWLMDLDALTGSRLPTSPLDFNGDEAFDSGDLRDVDTNGDGTMEKLVASGFSLDQIASRPGIVGGSVNGSGADFAITTTSNSDRRSDRLNAGPGAVGRQSWRQLR